MELKTLSTDRLLLVPYGSNFADSLFELFQDPELYTYIPSTVPTDLNQFRKEVALIEGRNSPDGKEYWLRWIPLQKATGKIVGLLEITLEKESRVAFLAYTTFREFWKMGYAREGCAELIRHMFSDWNATKIVIEMDVRNTASVHLAESLGATRVLFKPKAQLLKEEWSDEYRYEIQPAQTIERL
jgi:ribosomal-protein-alanine N-acetyltransferase